MKIYNGAPGLSSKVSKHQIEQFLLSGTMNLQFGTMDEKNEPNIHPVWYIYENQRLYFATETKSKKIKNILRNKTVYFSVANETEPFMGVRGKGMSKILKNKRQNHLITQKIISKYLQNTTSKLAQEVLDEINDGSEIVVEIKPQYYAAWSFNA